jgi:hypothetical protein
MAPNERAEVAYLQSLSEAELREIVLIPLLIRMGYRNVRSLHGPLERGKDIVFSQQDPLARERHYAAVVKKGPLSGSVASSNSLRTMVMQIQQSLQEPFLDARDGRNVMIDRVYVITAHPLSQQAIMSCSHALESNASRFSIIDGPALADLIRQYQPDATWSIPKDLPRMEEEEAPKETKTAFVLMPFGGHYDSYYGAVFKPGLEAAGYSVRRADDMTTPQPIIKDIQDAIVDADVILCEMSSRNANVFYELGLAHAVGKPVILLADNIADVPFDLRHIRVVVYDIRQPDWGTKLRDSIRAAAQSINKDEVWPPPLLRKN